MDTTHQKYELRLKSLQKKLKRFLEVKLTRKSLQKKSPGSNNFEKEMLHIAKLEDCLICIDEDIRTVNSKTIYELDNLVDFYEYRLGLTPKS